MKNQVEIFENMGYNHQISGFWVSYWFDGAKSISNI